MTQVSLSASTNFTDDPNRLIEDEGTIAALGLNLDEAPPASGTTVSVVSPNLSEFDGSQIQVEGGELTLNEAVETQLEEVLASKLTTVPGAAIATTSPFGSWSGAVGLANLETETPVQVGDRFEIGSITKTFTATALLKLVDAGSLSLDDTLTDWLPETVPANVANASEITLRQLLNHTSGVPEYDFILLDQGMSNPLVFLRDWQPSEIVELIGDSAPFFAPGDGWQYSNTNYILAGMVIEAATGNDLATEIQDQIIAPLGLDNTFFSTTKDTIPGGYISGYLDFDADGSLDDVSIANLSWSWAAGAMVSTPEDLTQYAQALYAGDLLSDAARAEMLTLLDTGRGYEYGLGLMSFDTPELGRVLGHRGGSLGFNANMWYVPETDFTYVELLNGRTEERLASDTIPAFTDGPIAQIGRLPDQFDVALTEQSAQLLLPVADDGIPEGEETVTFSVQPGADYSVNPDAQTRSLTILDSKENTSMLPDRVVLSLEEALDNNLPPEVPGAAVAILTPEGEWFGASGVSDVENNVALQPDDRFEAGSITKTFVATTLLQLVEEGQLTLEDTLTQWLPAEITDLVPNASEITIEQILNHTSGIADYLDILADQALSNPTLFLQEWTSEQLVGFIDGVEPFFSTPGIDWQYSNTNYILAGEVIEAVTGNSYGQEIRDRIIDPLGLENTFVFGEEEIPGGYINSYWDFNNDGTLDNLNVVNLSWTGSAGSIISNTEDLADFFDGLLVEGALLEAETLEEMLDTIPVESPNYDTYGLGIGTLESRNRFWYVHRGQTLSFRSNLWYSPLEDISYVELLNGRSDTNLVSDLLPTYRREIDPPPPTDVDPTLPNDEGEFQITSGATSLFLDFSLLETAGLTIQDSMPTADPFSSQFQLGFAIEDGFTFESVPFTPDGGVISHTGDISFLVDEDVDLTVGDFEIGFDAERVSETNSGFFVADTLDDSLNLDILFDISNPGRLLVQGDELVIADADLLLAPELASALSLDGLEGTDVGDTRIDADIVPLLGPPPPEGILGTEANDALVGTDGPDRIEALGGNDVVAGELGDDVLLGGDGDDLLRGDLNSRATQDGEPGGNDIIFGGEGNDRIGGKSGNDILSGDAGDDFIWGDDGDDIIMGVTGDDVLVGDNFSGGSGSDLFVFGNDDGTDTVLDFEVGRDRIGLVEGELLFADITLTQDGSNTFLGVASTGETLAILNNVQASALSESSFEIVADVSNVEEALALV
ncbi:MAG: serine hydrolase [Cyanobacteria bacterium J06627_28]